MRLLELVCEAVELLVVNIHLSWAWSDPHPLYVNNYLDFPLGFGRNP